MEGFFELKSVRDLLAKAQHDLARLRANPLDSYAAFDFFVTLRHIPHWLYPDDPTQQAILFAAHVELRICRHIADGAKHFVLNDPRHKQVEKTERRGSAWGEGTWAEGVWGNAWGEPRLVVTLDPRDPDTAAFGANLTALDLAERSFTVVNAAVQTVPPHDHA